MTDTVSFAHVQGFTNGFYSLSQQRHSRFENYVRTDGDVRGKWIWFQRLGAIEMVERTSRHQDTNIVENPHSRRGCALKDYEAAALLDPQDLHRMIDDPMNSYVQNAVFASNRNKDSVILRAVNGTAVSADEDDAQTSNALPSAQKIAAGGTGLTLAKLEQAREILALSEAKMPEDEMELPLAVSPKQMTNLLNITEVKSIDYNDGKALTKGRVARFMGFVFIETNRLSTNSAGARLCVTWKPSAIGFRMPDGSEGKQSIDKRPDKGNALQALNQQSLGGVRIEDEGVVEIACVET